jgi:hypothetical protein
VKHKTWRLLCNRALSNQEKDFTAVIVVHEANRVVGNYSLAPTAIVPSRLPRSIRTGQPPDPVPCLLLGQLARDQNWTGKGVGTGLLKYALQRCVTAEGLIGGRALIVNAVDAEAAACWGDAVSFPQKTIRSSFSGRSPTLRHRFARLSSRRSASRSQTVAKRGPQLPIILR